MLSPYKPNLRRVLADAAYVIRAHPCHFLVLSALFLLPEAIDSIADSFLNQQHASIHPKVYRRSLLMIPQNENPQFRAPILYLLLSLLFSLSATASITYSTFHGVYGKPVDLISSLDSALASFLPLLATIFATKIVICLIICAAVISAFLAYNGLSFIGSDMDYDSQYFVAFVALMVVVLVVIVVYLEIEWALSNAVVVVESKWGFQALRRSCKLVKGVKGTVALVMFVYAVLSIAVSLLLIKFSSGGMSLISGLVMAVYAIVITVLPLYGTAVMAILFAYCREWNGEADEELGYAKLPAAEGD